MKPMKRMADSAYQWVYYLTAFLLLLATVLRTLIVYGTAPTVVVRDLALLAIWAVLFAGEPVITRRWQASFFVYLAVQTALVAAMMLGPQSPDYFAILFGLLSMRIVQQLNPWPSVMCIAAFALVIAATLMPGTGLLLAVIFAMTYSAASAFFAYASLEARRVIEAHSRNEVMQEELRERNRQLQAYSDRLKQLAVERERHRIARDLHDSVTQTVFSMTLTVQSAMLLLDRDPARLKPLLDHLSDLARSALAEMQTLVAELRPSGTVQAGLVAALRRHIAERTFPEQLSVSLEAEGDQELTPAEEQGLFRIAQEALNNIAKHAGASRACLHVRLTEPVWIEITDNGRGFAVESAGQHGGMGLPGMQERAAEIGWDLQVTSTPGEGTRIHVQRGGRDDHGHKD
jgi:signal transduction histidine kinase